MEAEEGKEAGLDRGRRWAAKVLVGPVGHQKAGLHNCPQIGQGGWAFLAPCQAAIARGPPEEGGMTLSEGLCAAEAVPREGRQLRADS